MSPDERMRSIEHRNAADEQIPRRDVTWLLDELHRLWRTNERLDAKVYDARVELGRVEDELANVEVKDSRLPLAIIRLRKVLGPR